MSKNYAQSIKNFINLVMNKYAEKKIPVTNPFVALWRALYHSTLLDI